MCLVLSPACPRSTTKAVTPRKPLLGSVVAKATKTSAIGALVTKVLLPFSTQPSPRRTAVVERLIASEPEPGSLMPCAPIHSPLHRRGR
jgi:hypothetical protein